MKKTAVILFAAAALAGCKGKNGAGDVQQDNRVLTKTETAESATVQLTEEFTSEIEPFRENDITPAASGVHIDRILVEVGDPVHEGQLIVTLDPTQYTQQLVQLKTVEDDYNRLLPVYEAGGISAQQIQQAKAQLDVQREVVANLKKNIEVRSPITGVVTARNYESGDLFSAQPILHIMQIDPLKVIANISEQYFPNVKVGMPVELKVDIFPDQTFTGTVSLIYPALDPTTRTFKVEVKVPNARRTLRPGMYARTIFNMGHKGCPTWPSRSRSALPSASCMSSRAIALPVAAVSMSDARSATAWTFFRASGRTKPWPSRPFQNSTTVPKWKSNRNKMPRNI